MNTPLNILNGTPEGVPLDVSSATLPINQLKNTVIKDDRSNSNVHRCIYEVCFVHNDIFVIYETLEIQEYDDNHNE